MSPVPAAGRTPGRGGLCLSGLALGLLLAPLARADTGLVNALTDTQPTRSQGLADAGTALGGDPTLMWINPAALASPPRSSVTLDAKRGYFSDVTGSLLAAFALSSGVLAIGAGYDDAGTETFNDADGTTRTVRLQQDVIGAVGYGVQLTRDTSAGATVKGLYSTLLQEPAAAAVAFDLGIQVRVTGPLKIGLAIQNVGNRPTYLHDAVSAPTTIRAGAALSWRMENTDTLVGVVDGGYRADERLSTWQAGVEYTFRDTVALRAGYHGTELTNDVGGPSFGLGVVWGGYRVDYSLRLSQLFDAPQSLALTAYF